MSVTDGLVVGFPTTPNSNWDSTNSYDTTAVSLGTQSIGGGHTADVFKFVTGGVTWTRKGPNAYSSPLQPYAVADYYEPNSSYGEEFAFPLFVFMPSSAGIFSPGFHHLWLDYVAQGNPYHFIVAGNHLASVPTNSWFNIQTYVCVKSGGSQKPSVWRLIPMSNQALL